MSNSEKLPFITVPDALHECVIGWNNIAAELQRAIAKKRTEKPILVVDCYPGVDELAVLNELQTHLAPTLTIHAADAYHSPERIDKFVAPLLANCPPDPDGSRSSSSPPPGGGKGRGEVVPRAQRETFPRPATPDPLLHLSGLSLVNFFNAEPLWRIRRTIDELKGGLVLIVGCGASLIAWGHILIYANLARREAWKRFCRNENGNLGGGNQSLPAHEKRNRAHFVDWPVTDRWKRPLIKRWDYVLDTNNPGEPKLAEGEDVRRGLRAAAERPFHLAPLFDSLEDSSLLLRFGDVGFEVPAIDLLFHQARALLGEAVHLRFGDAFPIRFDSLKRSLLNRFELLGSGKNWREERAGLPEGGFLEVRRQWFSKTVVHDTHGGVNVLNLEGDEAIVESPAGAFEPFILHQAETLIIPAAVGRYNIRPHGPSAGKEIAIIKAFVRR